MLERISFLSCHAHSQLTVSWMKIWIAKETVVIGSRLRHRNHCYRISVWCVCVRAWPCTCTCVCLMLFHVVTLPASILFLYRTKSSLSFDILIMLFWKLFFWKIKKKRIWTIKRKHIVFPKDSVKGCLILTCLFLLSAFNLCYFYCLTSIYMKEFFPWKSAVV